VEEDNDAQDITSMTVPQLKAFCRKKGLPVSGSKKHLVARLQEALKGEEKKTKKAKKTKMTKKTKTPRKKKEESSEEEEEEEEEEEKPIKKKAKKKKRKVDDACHLSGATVYDNWDCMLNQTNISNNNNKYYRIQVLEVRGGFYCWTHWGRVGEPGQNALVPCGSNYEAAIKKFKQKFKDKTKNHWDNRDDFTPVPGKYTLLEMDHEDDDEDDINEALESLSKSTGGNKNVLPCTLPKATQKLIKLIFDKDMFRTAMKDLEIDVKKMPLGKLSKDQIRKGNAALAEIEKVLKKHKKGDIEALTSTFYTLVPHSFGRRRPPVINDLEHLQKKFDLLTVLNDIEIAQSLKDKAGKKKGNSVPHPLDQNYAKIKTDLEPLKKNEHEYKVIEAYLKATECSWRKLTINNVYRVSRHGEDVRFAEHKSIKNRKLLWHGTNVAVVVAILSSGLRIMPHSGGRVGKGIYFASENSKSAGYVGLSGKTGIMFLSEVALGKEHHINRDDSSLRKPPAGYDSIIAKGRQEPDPTMDTSITIDGNKVIVPQGKPIVQKKWSSSSFSQTEYLIYKESQNRIRYLLDLTFN